MKDIIYIKDLRVKTIIGIFDWERKVNQEVSIDMEFPFESFKVIFINNGLFDILRILFATTLFILVFLSNIANP